MKQTNTALWVLTSLDILHEECFVSIANDDHSTAKKYLMKAISIIPIEMLNDQRLLLPLSLNDLLRGFCEFNLGHPDVAESFAHSALNKLNPSLSRLKPYVYVLLAQIALQKKELDVTKKYLEMIKPYLLTTRYEELKILTYGTWRSYYQLVGDFEKILEYTKLENEVKEVKGQISNKILDEHILSLRKSNLRNEKSFIILFWCSIVMFVVAIASVWIIYKRKKTYKERYVTSINEKSLSPNSTSSDLNERNLDLLTTEDLQSVNLAVKEPKISKETEIRLLEEFDKQEAAHFYIKKGISLQQLAFDMGTNSRYVTYIIQKHRGATFYDYLQKKRIQYIMEQLRKNPEMGDYKLSYLAEISGFASLSKFSTAFKKISGMPPSIFIYNIKENNS